MRTYSIYQKPCPSCGAAAAVNAGRCDCGHVFSPTGNGEPSPEEQALQEEELFAAYLTARIDQAVEAVEAARAELAGDLSDRRKADKLVRAVQDALSLRDERDAQADRIRQLRAALPSRPDEPVLSAEPTEAFRAQQTARAERLMETFANTETKTCPHCHIVLPVASALCLCGYIFARKDFLLPRAMDGSTRGDIYRAKPDFPPSG